jgi:hypothetical protein
MSDSKHENEGFLDVLAVREESSPDDVNELLAVGWILLRTYTQSYGDAASSEHAVYVLAWPRAAGEIIDPIAARHAQQEPFVPVSPRWSTD